MNGARRRVRAIAPVTGSGVVRQGASFACAYATDIMSGDSRSSEQWARDIWEGSPVALRWFMVVGWRRVLRLPLGPAASPDHILGWPVVDRQPDETVCGLGSSFLTAFNSFHRQDGSLVWSTFVFYDRPIARFIWVPVSLVHRRIVRLALVRAQRNDP